MTNHCLVLQKNIQCIIKTNSGKTCFSFWTFSTSVPSFIFAVKFLPSHVFSPLNHIIDSNWWAELQSRVQTLADALYKGCALKFNWDSPFVIMWISSILCPAVPFIFKYFTAQLTAFVILRKLSLCYLWKRSSAIWQILDFLTVHY